MRIATLASGLMFMIGTISCTNESFVKGTDPLTGLEANHKLLDAKFINTNNAPLKIIEVLAGETQGKYGLSEWRFAIRVENISSKGVKRYDLLMPIYDDFKEKITTISYSETEFTKVGQIKNHKVYSKKLDFGKGAFTVVYLSRVAFDDGTFWETKKTNSDLEKYK